MNFYQQDNAEKKAKFDKEIKQDEDMTQEEAAQEAEQQEAERKQLGSWADELEKAEVERQKTQKYTLEILPKRGR